MMVSSKLASITAPSGAQVNLPATATTKHTEIDWDLIDSPRIKATTKVPEKIQQCLTGNWNLGADTKSLQPSNSTALDATSETALEKILAIGSDIEKATDKCLHRLIVPRQRLAPLVRELAKIYPRCSISLSGFFLYPPNGGFMGWHTNSDAPYKRIYITHVPEGRRSFFRYRIDGKCVTSYDEEGWTMRQFEVTDKPEDRLWHAVYSDTKRMSVGFRIIRNLK